MISKANKHGFTLVELLIVIVIIAILAAISIVAYNGITNRANDSAVQADLRGLSTKMKEYQIDNGTYPFSSASASDLRDRLATINIQPAKPSYVQDTSRANFLYVTYNNGADFLIIAQSKSGNNYYTSSKEPSVHQYGPDFISQGMRTVRNNLIGSRGDTSANAGSYAWGFGTSGWASEWIF